MGAQSLLNGSRALAGVVGPGLDDLLVQALTAPLAIAVDALWSTVSAVYLLRVKAVEPPCEEERRGLLLSGARFIAGSPVVRPALLATATLNFSATRFSRCSSSTRRARWAWSRARSAWCWAPAPWAR